MADLYVYSGATGTGDGSSWANAFTTLAAALAAGVAGDTFWVADDHSENAGATITLTSPGTADSPCRIICVRRDGGSVPPVSADLRLTAAIANGGNFSFIFNGFAYTRGVVFTSTGASAFTVGNSGDCFWWFDFCEFSMTRTTTATAFLGGSAAANRAARFTNTNLRFGHANHTWSVRRPFEWFGGTILGTVPTTLFTGIANAAGQTVLRGVDLSPLTSGHNLISVAAGGDGWRIENCKLGASVAVVTGSFIAQDGAGAEVRLVNCDSADTNYRYALYRYQGDITQETTIVRTGGASDGTTPISRKMVSSANAKFFAPLESDPIVFWNETTGSEITATVEVVTDNVTLTDAEAWIEVEYLGTSGFPLSLFVLDRSADVLASGTNQTSSSETWTTTGLTTPVKQKLSVAFTPQEKGPVRVRVCLAKPSTTMYFCPKVVASGRQHMMSDGAYMNQDAASPGGGVVVPVGGTMRGGF